MRVGLYLRVSTVEQAKEGYSIGEQEERLKDYCKAMRWSIYKIYVDPGYSGGDTNRPGLQDLMSDVKEGLLDKVVVYKLDRLSRSQLDTLFLIEKVFLANGTDFVSMSENFDTSTPFGRAMIGILAVFAQLEREQIKERMNMGKEARAKEGKWHGGAYEPIGYDYDPATEELNVNDYEKLQILELVDLFLKGTPLRTIETMFLEKGYKHKHGSTWDPKTMRRILRSKVYIGYNKYRNEWYKGEHTPFYDEDKYNAIIKLLDARREHYELTGIKPGAQTTFLGGLLHCKHCGGKYSKQLNSRYREGKPKVYWYSCYSRHKRVKKMIKDPNCKNKNWKMVELDEAVFNEIRKLAVSPEYISEIKASKKVDVDVENKVKVIDAEIKKINEQISRFMDLYGIGKFTIDQVSGKVDPLNDQKRALEKEREKLTATEGTLTEEEALEIVESFEEAFDSGDFVAIRSIVESLIYYIELDNDDVYIHWKI